MEHQGEENFLRLFIYFREKKVSIITDPRKTIRCFLDSLKEQAKENPEEFLRLPEMDIAGGYRIRYMLGRENASGKLEILKELNNNREEQSLFDYNVKDGDELILIRPNQCY
jgi:hypothetical protein